MKDYTAIVWVILGFFCVNTIVLDIYTIINKKPKQEINNLQQYPIPTQSLTCPQSCVDMFMSPTVTSSSASTPTPTLTPTPSATPTLTPTPVPAVKEFFIPLGSGFGNASDWTTITGIGATIDPTNYGQIDKAYFEVTARIPTGNQTVYIRLYNANTYQSVANSDVSLSGGTPTILVSQPISLTQGKNLYQIQMKTQLQYQTYIDQARIRIVTK